MRRDVAFAVVLSLGVVASAGADEILLMNGNRLSGVVVERTSAAVTIEFDAGRITLPSAAVKNIIPGQAALATYEDRAARLATKDVQGWLELGLWARDHDLSAAARRAFDHVLIVDPDNAAANRALGNVLLDGHWLSPDEANRARGLVRFEGQWMSVAEQQALLAERRLDADQALAQQESAARLAEAQSAAEMAQAQQTNAAQESWASYGWPFGLASPGYGLRGRSALRHDASQGSLHRGFGGGGTRRTARAGGSATERRASKPR